MPNKGKRNKWEDKTGIFMSFPDILAEYLAGDRWIISGKILKTWYFDRKETVSLDRG